MQQKNSKEAKIVFEILAEVISDERKKLNKSLRLLADEYDIQKSLLSRIENAKNEPKLLSILTICEALGLKPSELFKKFEDKLPKDSSLIDNR